jgi:hypothetical protein
MLHTYADDVIQGLVRIRRRIFRVPVTEETVVLPPIPEEVD